MIDVKGEAGILSIGNKERCQCRCGFSSCLLGTLRIDPQEASGSAGRWPARGERQSRCRLGDPASASIDAASVSIAIAVSFFGLSVAAATGAQRAWPCPSALDACQLLGDAWWRAAPCPGPSTGLLKVCKAFGRNLGAVFCRAEHGFDKDVFITHTWPQVGRLMPSQCGIANTLVALNRALLSPCSAGCLAGPPCRR